MFASNDPCHLPSGSERLPGWRLGLLSIWQRRLVALDQRDGRLLMWSDLSGVDASKAVDLFAADSVELNDSPPASAPPGLAGTLTIRLRDGRSNGETVVLASESIAILKQWRRAAIALAAHPPATPLVLAGISALRLVARLRKTDGFMSGWLWKRRDHLPGYKRRWFALVWGSCERSAGGAMLLYYSSLEEAY